jgi:hypothetical protein
MVKVSDRRRFLVLGIVVGLVLGVWYMLGTGRAADPQFAYADSTISNTVWATYPNPSGHQWWDGLVAPSDGLTTRTTVSNPINRAAEATLSDVEDPNIGSGHVLHWDLWKPAGATTLTVTMELRQGTITIASFSHVATTTVTAYDDALTTTQAAAITDYAALNLRINANTTGSGASSIPHLTYFSLEVPPVQPVEPTTFPVPPGIPYDCSVDVKADLQAWVATVPDGVAGAPSKLLFPTGSCYLVGADHGLQITNRNHLLLSGYGSTLRSAVAFPNGTVGNKGHILSIEETLTGTASDISVEGFQMEGTNPNPGVYDGVNYVQHAFRLAGGVDGVDIQDITVGGNDGIANEIRGDTLYASTYGGQGVDPEPRNITADNVVSWGNGRACVSLVNANTWMLTNWYCGNLRGGITTDRNSSSDAAPNGTITGLTLDGAKHYGVQITAGSNNIAVDGVTCTAVKSCRMIIKGFLTSGGVEEWTDNVSITNVSSPALTDTPGWWFGPYVSNLTVQNNLYTCPLGSNGQPFREAFRFFTEVGPAEVSFNNIPNCIEAIYSVPFTPVQPFAVHDNDTMP